MARQLLKLCVCCSCCCCCCMQLLNRALRPEVAGVAARVNPPPRLRICYHLHVYVALFCTRSDLKPYSRRFCAHVSRSFCAHVRWVARVSMTQSPASQPPTQATPFGDIAIKTPPHSPCFECTRAYFECARACFATVSCVMRVFRVICIRARVLLLCAHVVCV